MGKKKDKRKKREREELAAAEAAATAAGVAGAAGADPAYRAAGDDELGPYADGAVEAEVVDDAFHAPPAEAGGEDLHVAATATAGPPAAVAAIEDAQVRLQRRSGGVLPAPPPGAPVTVAAREIIGRIAGATLCYGEPVRAGDRAVIPVARVQARGGMGFGGNADDGGGGGGGMLKAAPAGFIEVTPEGTTYVPAPRGRTGGLAAGAAVVVGAAAGVAGAVLAGRRRTAAPRGLRGAVRRLGR